MNTVQNPQQQPFEAWALVELFGHQRIVGRVTEQPLGGASFIRVDVPDATGETAFTRMYGAAAIYSISPIDRAMAIELAQACDAVPVRPYELRQLPPPSATTAHEDDCEDRDDRDDDDLT